MKDVEGAALAIVQSSAREMVRIVKLPKAAGGSMPVDTSFLQNSLQPSTEGIPTMRPDHTGEDQPPHYANAAAIEAAISNMKLGDVLHFGFTAAYAARQNYGFVGWDSLGRYYNQTGNLFLERAVQQWPEIVAREQRRLAGRLVFDE